MSEAAGDDRAYVIFRIDPPGTIPRLFRLGGLLATSIADANAKAAQRWPESHDPSKPGGGFGVFRATFMPIDVGTNVGSPKPR